MSHGQTDREGDSYISQQTVVCRGRYKNEFPYFLIYKILQISTRLPQGARHFSLSLQDYDNSSNVLGLTRTNQSNNQKLQTYPSKTVGIYCSKLEIP